jgi:hypothetical protein
LFRRDSEVLAVPRLYLVSGVVGGQRLSCVLSRRPIPWRSDSVVA